MLEAYFFIMSLAPRKHCIEGRLVPNDARLILDTIRGSPRELRTSYESEVSHRVGRLLQENRGREAHELLAGECFADEMAVGFKTIWIQLLDQYGRHDEADLEIARFLEASTSGEERVNALDALACLPLYYGNARRLPEAFRYIDEALQLAPDKWTLKGTKGSLLVDSGVLDDGIAMLEEVLSNTETALDRAISNYYLALAWHRKGDPAKCDLHWRRGLELDPDCIVKPRVKEAIFDS